VPEPLGPAHVTDEFRCGSAEQTEWLRRFARQSDSMGTTKVFVATQPASDRVVAYYAWCLAHLTIPEAPDRLRKSAGRYPQPVALLARLGVDVGHERRGLGAGLLTDAIVRVAAISDEIGCRGLLVHAESQTARDFYLHVVPEFETSPTDELHLVLMIKDIRRTLGL
jgi:hypothetical protein